MSKAQEDRNQEATVYMVSSALSVLVRSEYWDWCWCWWWFVGKLRWEMFRCSHLGTNVTSRTSRYDLPFLPSPFPLKTKLWWFCTNGTVNVHLPKDRISMSHQGYGFCEFLTEDDAEYACKIMNQIKLYGKPIRVNKVRFFLVSSLFLGVASSVWERKRWWCCVRVWKGWREVCCCCLRENQASSDRKQIDIGANLFIGNLDANVDERMLFDTFMSFGTLVAPANVRLHLLALPLSASSILVRMMY